MDAQYYYTLPARTLLFRGEREQCDAEPPDVDAFMRKHAFIFASDYTVAQMYQCRWVLGIAVARPLKLFIMTADNIGRFLRAHGARYPTVATALKQVTGLRVARLSRFARDGTTPGRTQ